MVTDTGGGVMRFISLFAGIGGIDLGFERAGMECVAQVEWDEFCQSILAKHWPDVPRYGDIRDVSKENLPAADLICGGPPCQPFSSSGKRRGEKDARYLWPEMLRVIVDVRPKWVVFENVANMVRMDEFAYIYTDLENKGYDVVSFILPASGIGAPHKRNRLFMVAHSTSGRCQEQRCFSEEEVSLQDFEWTSWWASEPGICRVADGIPDRVDRLRALGNAVVPQLMEIIGRIIMQADREMFSEGAG